MNMSRSRPIAFAVIAAAVLGVSGLLPGLERSAMAGIRYVDASANGANNGTSWPNAFNSLQSALSAAIVGDEIWVAAATYKPAGPNGPRTATFQLKNGVAVYGGFPVGGGDFSQRDPVANPTNLSGDLNGNDVPGAGPLDPSTQDNSFHVVTGTGTNSTAVIDGFIVRSGYTEPGGSVNVYGGGMRNEPGSPTVHGCTFRYNWGRNAAAMYNANGSHPAISNCTFVDNVAQDDCAGIMNEASTPTITGCLFQNNIAANGAGMYNISSNASITNCTFSGNTSNAGNGGGAAMRNSVSNPTVVDCDFTNNTCSGFSGAGGAILIQENSSPNFTNCTFLGNGCPDGIGGAVVCGFEAHTTFLNCTFTSNSARFGGGAIAGGSANLNILDCTFTSNVCTQSDGGALRIADAAMIRGCTFSGNSAVTGGGGRFIMGTAKVVDCDFIANTAQNGGGIYCGLNAHTTVVSCRFVGNIANPYYGGGVYNYQCDASYTNCLFSGNTAGVSGAAVLDASNNNVPNAFPVFSNCTFSLNSSSSICGGVYTIQNGTTALRNCILWGNTGTGGSTQDSQVATDVSTVSVNFCCIQGLTGSLGGTGNIAADPIFLDADGADDDAGTLDDDLHLETGSPASNSGSNSLVPNDVADVDGDNNTAEPVPYDLDGAARIVSSVVDMGALESTGAPGGPGVYVGPTNGNWSVARNWAGNAVPGAQTFVFIPVPVVIDQAGAQALSVTVLDGGGLLVQGGSLIVSASVSIESGAEMTIGGQGSLVSAPLLTTKQGASLTLGGKGSSLLIGSLTFESGSTFAWDAGLIRLDAGQWNHPTAIAIGCSTGPAELRLVGNAAVNAPALSICSEGTLSGDGSINTSVTNSGQIAPGSSPGLLTITGNYVQTSTGSLSMQLASLTVGAAHDRISVGGSASLAGSVDVSVIDPQNAEVSAFDILNAGSVGGSFASVTLPEPPGDYLAALQQSTTAVSVGITLPGPRLYVDDDAAPGGTGTGWANALNSLTTAAIAARLNPNIAEIWVAQGTYIPTEQTNPNDPLPQRTATLKLVSGLSIYGGFAGGETDLSQRDFIANVTILSGDVNGNDGPNFTNRSDNLYQVVLGSGVNNTAVLDGFTIRGGYASNPGGSLHDGGGVYCGNGNPTIRNCIVTDNYALSVGAGVFHSGGLMSLSNCQFIGNTTLLCGGCGEGKGGGAFANAAASSATLADCTFSNNSAEYGGGLWNDAGGSVTLTNCAFNGNHVQTSGAGITSIQGALTLSQCSFTGNGPVSGNPNSVVGGGVSIQAGSAMFNDCQFTNNSAYSSGAVDMVLNIGTNVSFTGCEFTSNSATQFGGAVGIDPALDNASASPTFSNCTFSTNSAGVKGGAVYMFHQTSNHINPTFNGCEFTGNSSTEGGAITSIVGIITSINGPKLSACTFQNNSAVGSGGAIRNEGGALTLIGCTFSNNPAPIGKAVYNVFKGTVRGDASFLNGDGMESTDPIRPGQLSPNPQTGVFTMHGPLQFTDRGPDYFDKPSLYVDVGGTTVGSGFDGIDALQGSVNLTGGLFVNFINGFQPQLGDSFEVVASPAINGQFSVALFPPMPPGLLMSANYGARGINLKVEQIQSVVAFADPSINGLAGIPSSAALGDVDNDGDADLFICIPATIPTGNGNAYILKNGGVDGSGNWLGFTSVTGPILLNVGPVDLTLGHFDSDAFLDFAVANQAGNRVLKFKNDGTGGFGAPVTITVTAPTAIAAGHLFNPQDSVVITTAGGNVIIRSFNAAGSLLAAQTTLSAGVAPTDVLVADIDLDSDNDIVVLNKGNAGNPTSKVSVHVNDTDNGVFVAPAFYIIGIGANSLVNDDLNSDGWTDLVASNTTDGTISVLINKADGTPIFASAVSVPIGYSPTSLATLDVEPDGDIDIVAVARNESNEPVVRLARNDINGGQTVVFTQFTDLVINEQTVLARCADLNGDGVKDVVTINQGTPGFAPGSPGSVSSRLNVEPASCPADIAPPAGDQVVNVADLLLIINSWGPCPGCPADIAPPGGDGSVNTADLLSIINAWGPCP